jgi:SRSO17 transposase
MMIMTAAGWVGTAVGWRAAPDDVRRFIAPAFEQRRATAVGDSFGRWLLARRSLREPGAIACCFACAPTDTRLAELAGAAGLRWTIEECFLRARDDLGLDHCEARSGMAGSAI